MPDLNFSNPQGQTLTVNSPDGSVPSEQELDTMFSQKFGSSNSEDNSNNEPNELAGFGQPSNSTVNPKSTSNPVTNIA